MLSVLSRYGEFSGDLSAWWRVLIECGEDDVPVLDGQVGQAGSAGDFEAVFVTEGGVERRVPWEWLPEVVGELVS